MSRYILGIDFGTTNLRIHRAVLDEGGKLEVPPQAAALLGSVHDALPTVLHLEEDDETIRSYGRTALDSLQASSDGKGFVQEFKPCLGQAAEDVAAQGKPAIALIRTCPSCETPNSPAHNFCGKCGAKLPEASEASASVLFPYSQDEAFRWTEVLLRRVVEDLTGRLYDQPLTPANGWELIAGVPVHWQEGTRQRFRNLLVDCFDNPNVELVTEPEAALRYHLWQQALPHVGEGKYVLVVDFGAGTTDVVVGRVSEDGKTLTEVKTCGERYGGGDFDVAVARYIGEELKIPLETSLPPILKHNGKELKESFSHAMASGQEKCAKQVAIFAHDEWFPGLISLSRSLFESDTVAGVLVAEFERLLQRAMKHFSINPEQVGCVVVTGGGAFWYFVNDALQKLFPDAPVLIGSEPDRAISQGLALAAAFLPPPRQPLRGEDIEVTLELTWQEAQQECKKTIEVEGHKWYPTIPPGVKDGETSCIKGKGKPGKFGGGAGDLIVTLQVAPQPLRGEDIHRTLMLTWEEAQQGCEKVVGLGGRNEVVIVPPEVKGGEVIRVHQKGMLGKRGGTPGDLIISIRLPPEALKLSAIVEEAIKRYPGAVSAELPGGIRDRMVRMGAHTDRFEWILSEAPYKGLAISEEQIVQAGEVDSPYHVTDLDLILQLSRIDHLYIQSFMQDQGPWLTAFEIILVFMIPFLVWGQRAAGYIRTVPSNKSDRLVISEGGANDKATWFIIGVLVALRGIDITYSCGDTWYARIAREGFDYGTRIVSEWKSTKQTS